MDVPREPSSPNPPTIASASPVLDVGCGPSPLGRQFGTVVDSRFLHVFAPEDADRFADELTTVLRPGGRYYLLAFTMRGPDRTHHAGSVRKSCAGGSVGRKAGRSGPCDPPSSIR